VSHNTVEYGSYIIDIIDAMLEHKHGMTNDQIEHVLTIRRRAVGFITDFLQAEAQPLEQFRSYLSHDAMSPITIVIGYAEILLMDSFGELTGPYRDAMDEILKCGYAMKEDIHELHLAIHNFLREEQAKQLAHYPTNGQSQTA